MSEWLTTGQMIDRLKMGETAEGNTHWEVKKTADGGGFDAIVELNSGDQVFLSESFMNEKWRILPNYVSFEKAMKAIKEGEKVYYVTDNGEKIEAPFKGRNMRGTGLESYNPTSLYEGKWTIGE